MHKLRFSQAFILLLACFMFSQASYAVSAPNMVYQIGLAPITPNILKFGQNVTVRFKYDSNIPAGVRIFARPFSGAALTPNYAACPSPLYPAMVGGNGTCTFTISSLNATVSRIRFQMFDAATGALVHETFIPVSYQFK